VVVDKILKWLSGLQEKPEREKGAEGYCREEVWGWGALIQQMKRNMTG